VEGREEEETMKRRREGERDIKREKKRVRERRVGEKRRGCQNEEKYQPLVVFVSVSVSFSLNVIGAGSPNYNRQRPIN
jgi:hypothetical protein